MKSHVRYVYGFLGFLGLIFMGMIYAWSIFIAPLEAEFGWLRSQTSFIFSISMIFFCIGNLVAGFVTPRATHRVSLLISAACMILGFMLSSRTQTLAWIYISYGVLCGLAVGIGANTLLSTTLKWFADRQGTASGALMMGYGFGSMVLGPFVTMLLGRFGWRSTFQILAAVFGVVLVLLAVIIRAPSQEVADAFKAKAQKKKVISSKEYTTPEMLRTRSFWLCICWMVMVGSGGLALISNAVPAAQDVLGASMDAQSALLIATSAMGMISVFNGLGRFSTGVIWDKKGHRTTLCCISVCYILSMILLATATSMAIFPVLVVGYIMLGAAYGGSMSVGSAMIGSFYGTNNYGMNYACASCNLIAASLIGPPLSGYLKTSSGSYVSSYLVILVFGVISLGLIAVIHRPDAQKPAAQPAMQTPEAEALINE